MGIEGEQFVLSNGQRLWIGDRGVDAYVQSQIDFVERFIAAGHTMGVNDENEVDLFYTSGDVHNGPGCSVCHDAVCMHCSPDYRPEPCPGAEAVAKREREQRYARYLELKAEFEPEAA